MADQFLKRTIPESATGDSLHRAIALARARGRNALSEPEAKALLASFGISVPRFVVARDAADAARRAAEMSGPFAVKVVAADVLHKSDAGGVALNLADAEAVAGAVEAMARRPQIAAADVEGWLIEPMVPAGCELVIGAVMDARFGPMVMVGLGGIFVEVLKDVSFRICPVDEREARAMLEELRGARLLDGVRGRESVDRDALVAAILAIAGREGLMMKARGEIAEIDLNPVIASPTSAVAADARIILAAEQGTVPTAPTQQSSSPLEEFRPLFEPRTVAVLGASTSDVTMANTFIRRMKDFGYRGPIYPIHPTAAEIEGLKAWPSLTETPEPIDYAYVALRADRIPPLLAKAGGRCRVAQVISSGFGEVDEGRTLEEALLRAGSAGGVRIVGPNCLGTYSPRGGLTFPVGAPKEVGPIGVVTQSGGLGTDIIKRGQARGLRFSGVVSIGNSVDVKPHEIVDYFLADPVTKAIGLYVEDIKHGRAFFELLRSSRAIKPVVILRGGRSERGRLAALSHTGALAGSDGAWRALAAQTPVALVATLDEFLDVLLMLQHVRLRPEKPTRSVVLFGNGGGSSVLGVDALAELGLDVAPFTGEARARLQAMRLPPGTSIANPIDTPVRTLQEKDGWVAGEILDIVYEYARPDAIAMHLNLAAFVGRGSSDPLGNLLKVVEQTQRKWSGVAHFALALRSDGSVELDERKRAYRDAAQAIGVPTFDEIAPMACALAAVGHLERRLAQMAV